MYQHFQHFQHASAGSDSSFWGAFLGAFFAFVFGLVMFYFTKKREKFVRHRNALIKLERLLNEHADELLIAKIHADETKKVVEANAVTDYRFKTLKLDDEVLVDLSSIDMINKYNLYTRSISRLNQDFEAKNRALTRFEDAKLAGRVLAQESVDYLARSFAEISSAIENRIDTQMLKLLATVRIYLRKIGERNPIIYGIFQSNRDFTVTDEEIKAEIKKLNEGVEQLRAETRADFKKFGTSQ
ncbi:MAG TPA: hypothetical protein VMR46_01875 [Candidatus Paceibacterota bacterium]|nr:hypothetical protein [Candidatus Paceibacterota bacterium]